MVEQTTYTPDEARFGDVYQSRFYQFGPEIQVPGDPDNPEDFARSQHYLETITDHLLEFGPVWEKTPHDIMVELHHRNAWQQYEVQQERKAGDKTAEYREITIQQLRALSKRRVLALEDSGWEVTHDYRVVCHIDNLVEKAVLEQEEIEAQIAMSQQSSEEPCMPASDQAEELPF